MTEALPILELLTLPNKNAETKQLIEELMEKVGPIIEAKHAQATAVAKLKEQISSFTGELEGLKTQLTDLTMKLTELEKTKTANAKLEREVLQLIKNKIE